METINQKLPRSTRRYPKKQCANSNCTLDKIFAPHDFRQLYCCADCRTAAGNDKRRFQANTIYSSEKLLKEYDRKLKKIYDRYVNNNHCQAPLSILEFMEIDLTFFVKQQINSTTGKKVNMFYEYGTEIHGDDKTWIIIHKKK